MYTFTQDMTLCQFINTNYDKEDLLKPENKAKMRHAFFSYIRLRNGETDVNRNPTVR